MEALLIAKNSYPRRRGALKTATAIIMLVVLYWGAAFYFNQPTEGYALQGISPVMESIIANSYVVRNYVETNYRHVVMGLGILTGVMYLAWLIFRKYRKFPGLMHPALTIAVIAQYLLIYEYYELGFVVYGLAGVVAFLHARLKSVVQPWDAYEPYRIHHYVIAGFLVVLGFVYLFYRIDNWVPCNFRWSDPSFYDVYQFMQGKLDMWSYAVIWKQQRETTSGECVLYVLPMLGLIKVFGFKILTFRLFSTFVAATILFLTYFIFNRFYNRRVAFIATGVMAVSGWHLLYARSETYVIFTIALPLFTYLMFLYGILEGRLWGFIGAGFGIGIIPYFYSVMRIIPMFLIMYMVTRGVLDIIWFNRHRLSFKQRVRASARRNFLAIPLMLGPFLVVAAPQFTDLVEVKKMYFSGRGEHVVNMTQHPHIMTMLLDDPTATGPYPLELRIRVGAGIMWSNITSFLRNLFGLRTSMISMEYERLMNSGFSVFMFLGLFLTISRWREERYLFMLLWLFFGIILAMGANLITPARVMIGVSPASFFIGTAIDQLWREWERMLGKAKLLAVLPFFGLIGGLYMAETTNFYPKYGQNEWISKPHEASVLVQENLKKTDVMMVFPTWNFYAEGYMRVYLEEWLKAHQDHTLELYFMFSNFNQLQQDILGGVFDERKVLFIIENNPESGADDARKILEAIKQRYPDLKIVLHNDWAWLIQFGEA